MGVGEAGRGMKAKKRHEVALMAHKVHDLCSQRQITKIVDVGAGVVSN